MKLEIITDMKRSVSSGRKHSRQAKREDHVVKKGYLMMALDDTLMLRSLRHVVKKRDHGVHSAFKLPLT